MIAAERYQPAGGTITRTKSFPQSAQPSFGKNPVTRIAKLPRRRPALETACMPGGISPCRWQRPLAALDCLACGGEGRQWDAAISPLGGFMGSFSIWHWMVVLLVVLLLFGGGKVSSLMGDFAKGIKAFKKNMAEPEDASMEASADKPTGSISGPAGEAAPRHARRPRRTDAQTQGLAVGQPVFHKFLWFAAKDVLTTAVGRIPYLVVVPAGGPRDGVGRRNDNPTSRVVGRRALHR